MDLIGSSRNTADGAHGGMQHHDVAGGDAEGAKAGGELSASVHHAGPRC
jgi:hypothetical protein